MTEAEQRELDRRVAVEVAGWTPATQGTDHWWIGPDGARSSDCPPFTTDPAWDYRVLNHVRQTWADGPRVRFSYRTADPAEHYRPGDWSRAALYVIDAYARLAQMEAQEDK